MISKSTIDQVFDTARVEEVIGDFVQLKKSGSNFKGLSPFSEERTPSFMVSPVKQIWKDFSTGKGGTVVSFLMEHEHFTYPEAIKYLAKRYNIEIEETQQTDAQKEEASERESMYLVNEFANSYFQNTLNKTDQGKAIGLSYFKERGFTQETIDKFQLGYSLDDWQAFTDEAIKKGYKLKYLESTGLTIVKEEKQFDRFKGRVMFPIHSMSGRVLGFGGRILDSTKKAAKYLNSPESDVYHKSKVLYGIYYAKQSIAKEDNCFLVEGYTDVIQFAQKGITNVVSSSGTALTPEQIRLINRLTKNITVLFDGDAAGIRASLRGIDLILEQGMNVKVCSFPEGEDPDSFAKQNTLEELSVYLKENAKDFISYKASLLMQEAKNDPIKKTEVLTDMVRTLGIIPDKLKQEVYAANIAKILNVEEKRLYSSIAQYRSKRIDELRSRIERDEFKSAKIFDVVRNDLTIDKVDVQYVLEKKIIELLLLYGNKTEDFEDLVFKETEEGELILEPVIQQAKVFEKIYLDLQEDEMEFTNPNFKDLYYTIIDALNQDENFAIESFVNRVDPVLANDITHILMNEERYSLHNWEKNNIFPKGKEVTIAQLVSETILSLRCFLIDKKVSDFKQETQNTSVDNKSILEDVLNYSNLKMLLSRKLNRVL
ncbi:DNA primase [Pontimicrobium sp. IMCC45349]|uniref:DNA primase n=1 Tax=Pontimicrobium sp. IMCC45349 TaxID=3391574 RepID=UPI0039A0BD96